LEPVEDKKGDGGETNESLKFTIYFFFKFEKSYFLLPKKPRVSTLSLKQAGMS
jgi:hypothetical protein